MCCPLNEGRISGDFIKVRSISLLGDEKGKDREETSEDELLQRLVGFEALKEPATSLAHQFISYELEMTTKTKGKGRQEKKERGEPWRCNSIREVLPARPAPMPLPPSSPSEFSDKTQFIVNHSERKRSHVSKKEGRKGREVRLRLRDVRDLFVFNASPIAAPPSALISFTIRSNPNH